MNFELSRKVNKSHEEALKQLKAALQSGGWGVLGDYDVKKILKERIGVDVEPYDILDVCSPRHADEGLRISRRAGLVLACKLAVYTEGGETIVSLYLPTKQLPDELVIAYPGLLSLAQSVETSLRRVVEGL